MYVVSIIIMTNQWGVMFIHVTNTYCSQVESEANQFVLRISMPYSLSCSSVTFAGEFSIISLPA